MTNRAEGSHSCTAYYYYCHCYYFVCCFPVAAVAAVGSAEHSYCHNWECYYCMARHKQGPAYHGKLQAQGRTGRYWTFHNSIETCAEK